MNDVYLNGRPAVDWEIPVIEHARKCERSRDLQLLAGLISPHPFEPGWPPACCESCGQPETNRAHVGASWRRPVGVPLARQAPELKARRRITDLTLDPLS